MTRPLAALLLIACCMSARASAQVVVDGRVIDDLSAQGLASARVLLLNGHNKAVAYAVTDETGYFRFSRRETGSYRLEVSAIGYRRVVTPFVWPLRDHRYAALEVRLAANTVLLAPVEVIAMSLREASPVLAGMEHRRLRGFGTQITREQIEARHPAQVSDMLLEVPGVYAVRIGSGVSGRILRMSRALAGPAGGACNTQIYLDGRLATREGPGGEIQVDELVSPLDIEAIEVFRGLGTVPPEFLTPNARCGVIAIWTKRSTDPRR